MARPIAPGRAPTACGPVRWRATDTSVDDIVTALAHLGREHPAVRATRLQLVVLTSDRDVADTAREAVRQLDRQRPSRTVVVVRRPPGRSGGRSRIDAEVEVSIETRTGGHLSARNEVVSLSVHGAATSHLDSVLVAFLFADVPLVAWSPGDTPTVDDAVVGRAERLVLDSQRFRPDALGDIVVQSRRVAIGDFAWLRIAPWRDAFAGLFDGVTTRPFLSGIQHTRVAGEAGSARLLAGWLASRLGAVVQLDVAPSRRVAIELAAEHDGRRARFLLAGPTGATEAAMRFEVDGERVRTATVRVSPVAEDRLLALSLAALDEHRAFEDDLVYNEALAAASATPGG